MNPSPDAPLDTQLERTVLSWRRTTVSFTAVALLLARLAVLQASRPVALAAVAAIGLTWAGAIHLTRMRVRSITLPVRRTLPLIVTLILLYCVTGTLLLVS
ncbi:DUF202 domain-containing protein [Dactylosporangium sp. NBC_01737]|uniref:DUF202 domain-containing protein n=1 Tax=Dactylosporangium sp. NBC_01737 TaxID=2975959 RepID=UPI002E0EBABE|nr:DUF202 domain-containing protein [Dactylosporangium sp. NBC_01737]